MASSCSRGNVWNRYNEKHGPALEQALQENCGITSKEVPKIHIHVALGNMVYW